MGYSNVKDLLLDATKLPAAIEGKLPAGAPKISSMLVDATGKIPAVPNFPVEIPSLPAPPAIPEPPAIPGLRKFISVSEAPPGAAPVNTKADKEIVPLVFE